MLNDAQKEFLVNYLVSKMVVDADKFRTAVKVGATLGTTQSRQGRLAALEVGRLLSHAQLVELWSCTPGKLACKACPSHRDPTWLDAIPRPTLACSPPIPATCCW